MGYLRGCLLYVGSWWCNTIKLRFGVQTFRFGSVVLVPRLSLGTHQKWFCHLITKLVAKPQKISTKVEPWN